MQATLKGCAPGDRIGSYVIEAELGRGACAVVYRIRHERRQTTHALKVLVWNSPPLRRRLAREGAMQREIRHPNVVPVEEVLEHEGRLALVMELIEGPSLERWLEQSRPDLAEVERIFREILAGLSAAHAAGVVHRDLKPANVLMHPQPGRVVPRITDFGIAQVGTMGTRLTRPGSAVGTPGYMAPEQFDDARTVDVRADVYSAGCILYQLCTGHPPFSGNMAAMELASRAGDFPDPRQLAPELPARFLRAIQGCLQPDPQRRLSSCEALLAVLEDRPAPALPAPAPAPPARSSAGLAGSVALLAAGLLLGVALTLLALYGLSPPAPSAPAPAPTATAAAPTEAPDPLPPAARLLADAGLPPTPQQPPPSPSAESPAPLPPSPPPPAGSPPQQQGIPAGMGEVVVDGDARQVWLQAGDQRLAPGPVPPGDYTIHAFFAAGRPILAGRVSVQADQRYRLTCSAQFQLCR